MTRLLAYKDVFSRELEVTEPLKELLVIEFMVIDFEFLEDGPDILLVHYGWRNAQFIQNNLEPLVVDESLVAAVFVLDLVLDHVHLILEYHLQLLVVPLPSFVLESFSKHVPLENLLHLLCGHNWRCRPGMPLPTKFLH